MEIAETNGKRPLTPHPSEVLSSTQWGQNNLSQLKALVREETEELFNRVASGGLTGAYLGEGLPLYFISDKLLEHLGYSYDAFMQEMDGCLLNALHPEDRAGYIQAMDEGLAENDSYEARCRVHKQDGSYCWMKDVGKRIRGETKSPAVVILRIDVTDAVELQQELEEKMRAVEERSRELATFTANLPGGVCTVAMDDSFTILNGNNGFYFLFGYTPRQLKEERNNRYLDVIFPEDRALVHNIVKSAYLQGEKGYEVEYRVVCRDGSIIWVLERGNYVNIQGKTLVNCVLLDLTERKAMEQALRINEERFRLALAQTENTIFDYDICSKTMIHADKSAESYGLETRTENVPYSLVEMGAVHPDSVGAFLQMYEAIQRGEKQAFCIVRTRMMAGEYAWRKISMTNIFDENGQPVRAIGTLEDIDAQRRREEELRYQSERDGLTGLYNKAATEARIREELSVGGTAGALFVIDIDTFKAVNDRYGHWFGDYVLTDSGRRISSLFKDAEIIGRIGGDEFIIFLSKSPAPPIVQKYANQICEMFGEAFISGGITANASCSIGIAFCPLHGTTFETLYRKADIALYEAKRSGKNQAVLFRPEMKHSEKWTPYSSTAIDVTI